jgi:hypothetical protein
VEEKLPFVVGGFGCLWEADGFVVGGEEKDNTLGLGGGAEPELIVVTVVVFIGGLASLSSSPIPILARETREQTLAFQLEKPKSWKGRGR